MDGKLGYRAWRWIFGIEGEIHTADVNTINDLCLLWGIAGLATIVVGLVSYFMVSEAPAQAAWLTPEERSYLQLRQKYAAGTTPATNHFEWKYVMQAITDWKAYIGCIQYFGCTVPVYGLNFALPTIINNLGYSAARAQGMSAPPYLFGCIVCIGFAFIGDRVKQRGYVLAAAFALAIAGFIIIITTAGNSSVTGVTLFGIFLTAGGLYAATPPMMAWVANIFEGEVKRGIAISLVPTIGQFGGIIGSNIYLTKERPYYKTGFGVSLGFVVIAGFSFALILRFALKRVNDNRDKMSLEEIRAKYTEEELIEMGDKSPLYRVCLQS